MSLLYVQSDFLRPQWLTAGNHSTSVMNWSTMWTWSDSFWTTTNSIQTGNVFKQILNDFPVGESAVIVNVKRKKSLYFSLNTEFTSPPSCQCERALVHYCQLHCWTWPSLACEELSKQLKFPGRTVSSQVLSQRSSLPFIPFSANAATWNNEEKEGGAG